VRLRDVGRAEIGAEDERKLVRFNGVPAVALGIVKQSTANTRWRTRQGGNEDAAGSMPPDIEVVTTICVHEWDPSPGAARLGIARAGSA
jgi:hypothetical protein